MDHDYFNMVDVRNFVENISYFIAGYTNFRKMLIVDKNSKTHYTRLFN